MRLHASLVGALIWLAAAPSTLPSATATPTQQLKVIGYVKALGPSAYRITAANPGVCPGGQPGRRLQLAARRGDYMAHPFPTLLGRAPGAEWHITYDNMRFSDTLDEAIFSLPQ